MYPRMNGGGGMARFGEDPHSPLAWGMGASCLVIKAIFIITLCVRLTMIMVRLRQDLYGCFLLSVQVTVVCPFTSFIVQVPTWLPVQVTVVFFPFASFTVQ